MSVTRPLLAAFALAAAGCSFTFSNPAEQLGPGEVGGRTTASAILLDGVAVSVKGASSDPSAGSSGLDAVSRASGRFTMLPLPAGTHTLTFRKGTDRATQRDVEIGYGKDGQLMGIWLGDVEVMATAGLGGSLIPPDPWSHRIVDGVAVDEVSGASVPLDADTFSMQGLAVGRHRLSVYATDEAGVAGVAGPIEVTLDAKDAGSMKSLGTIALHPAGLGTADGTTATLKVRVRVAGGVTGLDLTQLSLTGLPSSATIGTSSSGLIQVDGLPEGYFTVGVKLPTGAPANLNPPPLVSFVAVGGATIDLGSVYAVTQAASDQALRFCRTDADCAVGTAVGTCRAGLCLDCRDGCFPWSPPAMAPSNVPLCDRFTFGCTAGQRYSSSGRTGDGTSACVAYGASSAAVACGGACTPDGVGVIASAPGQNGCPLPTALTATWTWVGGSKSANPSPVYGTRGVADLANAPGPRQSASTWIDAAGDLWLFGGNGYDSAGYLGQLNDLWRFDGTSWTWVSGSELVNQAGAYGTMGTADPANTPGGRYAAASWIDAVGHLYLFGGYGLDAGGVTGTLSDLWVFDGTAWAWIDGPTTTSMLGSYGALGTAAAGNWPGSRFAAATWKDPAGHVWLFGGYGNGGDSTGDLNDLWRFDGAWWAWMGGSTNSGAIGLYGTRGTAASGNGPGAREYPTTWVDSLGRTWLFGGYGKDSDGVYGDENDLWMFDGTLWTWVAGPSLSGQLGVYGTSGVADPASTPGARQGAVGWIDAQERLWLFGGYLNTGEGNRFNDLWMFDGTAWTWVSGSDLTNQWGSSGTLGVAAPTNLPGSRSSASVWIDAGGDAWLFGGYGYDGVDFYGYLNDLWRVR